MKKRHARHADDVNVMEAVFVNLKCQLQISSAASIARPFSSGRQRLIEARRDMFVVNSETGGGPGHEFP